MPIEYKLEKDGALVIAYAKGELSLDCFLAMQKKMKADTNLRDTHDTLLNVRSVSKIRITEKDLNVIAQGLTSGSKKLGARRLAIVAHQDQAFILGNKYKTVEKGVKEKVLVFFNEDIALTWLRINE